MAKEERFEIRISTYLKNRLHSVAVRQDLSDSEAARLAIRKWIEQEDK